MLNTPRMPSSTISACASSHASRAAPSSQCLAVFQIAGRQGPEAAARFDGAAAHQHGVVGDHDGTDHDLRIVIGNMTAIGADQALAIVTFGNPADEVRHAQSVSAFAAADQSLKTSKWIDRRLHGQIKQRTARQRPVRRIVAAASVRREDLWRGRRRGLWRLRIIQGTYPMDRTWLTELRLRHAGGKCSKSGWRQHEGIIAPTY